jgi:hypothetical protein
MRRAFSLVFVLCYGVAVLAQACKQVMPAIVVEGEARTFDSSMTAERLHAKIGRLLVPITRLERITSFRVLILMDVSGSMEVNEPPVVYQRKVLALVRDRLQELVATLPHDVKVQYGEFNSYAVFGGDFSSDRKVLESSLPEMTERLKHRGPKKTALYDAIQQAILQFGSVQPGDSILVVTDGGDNNSNLSDKKVREEAAARGIRLFTILVKGESQPYEEQSWDVTLNLAERTGGSVHIIDSRRTAWMDAKTSQAEQQNLSRFWQNEVLAGYLLYFEVPAGPKNRKWLLRIDRMPGQKKEDLASYPSRLNACLSQSASIH